MTSLAIAPSTREWKSTLHCVTGSVAANKTTVLSYPERMVATRSLVVRMRLPVRQQSERPAAWARNGPGNGGKPQADSGGERVRMRLFIDRDRFKAIIAGAAEPEERRAARTALDPIGPRDRLAALGTRISAGQIAGIESSHGASPF